MVELLAPCHNFPTLKAAVENGANAVYFGIDRYNMRVMGKNFKLQDLNKISNYCHKNNVKCYLTINSIIYENELNRVKKLVFKAKSSGIDAIIIHDLSLIKICKEENIPFHISTQASVSNSEAVNFYGSIGAQRVILAREVNLKDLKKIVKKSKVPIEVFIHGAMCVSISGRCFFSQVMYNKSANRGECMQPCRQKWSVKNKDGEFIYENQRFLNAKDLCTISFIDKIIKTGVSSLKIEGRRKDSNYVGTVVKIYRQAIDNFNKNKINRWEQELKKVFNRGFSTGFYLGVPTIKDSNLSNDGTISTTRKVNLGIVQNYFNKLKVAQIFLNHNSIKLGDEIIIEGKTTYLRQIVSTIQQNKSNIKRAGKGEKIAIKVNKKVRKNDLIYIIKTIKNN